MPQSYAASKRVLLTYSTPMYVTTVRRSGRTNDALRELILAKEARSPGLQKSNVGGWHSESDFFAWDNTAVDDVLGWIGKGINELTGFVSGRQRVSLDVSGWANISRRGHYHRTHMHPSHHWSGVYYVDPGEPTPNFPDSGIIEFHDPRAGVGTMDIPGRPFWGTVHFRPESGMLLIFPSWLAHFVNPYQGDGERISLSFNVMMHETDPG